VVDLPRRLAVEQAGGLVGHRHLGDHELDRLVLGDRLAEGLALLGVARDSSRQRRIRPAHCAAIIGRDLSKVSIAI
jgi:hypothetical protein